MYTYRYIMPSGLIQFVNTAINILIMYTDFFVVCLFVCFVCFSGGVFCSLSAITFDELI